MNKTNYRVIPIVFVGLLMWGCEEEVPFTSLQEVSVSIRTPYYNSILNPKSPTRFLGHVIARDTTIDITRLTGNWTSDKDGLLFSESIKENGYSEFSTNSLSRNVHEITFEVENERGETIISKTKVINTISLQASEENDYSVTLDWSPGKVNNFISYKLYRTTNGNLSVLSDAENLLVEITDFADSIYVDTTAILGQSHYYQVVVNNGGDESLISNIAATTPGRAVSVNYPISKILTDRKRNFVYGIVNPGPYSENSTGYGLVIIDKNELNVVKRMFENERFKDIDISPDGDFLYAGRRDNIYVISLESQERVKTIRTNNFIRELRVGSNERLYYHVELASNNNYEFRTVDLSTDTELPHLYEGGIGNWSFHSGHFDIDTDDNTIYHGDHLSSNTLSVFKTTNDQFSSLKQRVGADLGKRMICMGSYVIWSHQLYSKELNFLGNFKDNDGQEEQIYDTSPDEALAVGSRNLFQISVRKVTKPIPAYYDYALFLDSSRLLVVKINHPQYQKYQTVLHRYTFKD